MRKIRKSILLVLCTLAALLGSFHVAYASSASGALTESAIIEYLRDGYDMREVDETGLHYYELRKKGAPQISPLLILLHSASNDKISMAGYAKEFADAGYTVVAPDLAGEGEDISPDALNPYDIIVRSSGNVETLVARYKAVDYVDAEHFCVAGNSLGALTALYFTAYSDVRPQCVISFYGTPVWSTLVNVQNMYGIRCNGATTNMTKPADASKLRTELLQHSPDQNMGRLLSVPVLLVNSDVDPLMSIDGIYSFQKEAAEYSNNLTVAIKPGHVHALAGEEGELAEAMEFLHKYLPAQ